MLILYLLVFEKKTTTLLWAKVRRADFHFTYIHANPLLSENRKYFFTCSGFESFWLKQNHVISNALSNDQNVLCNCFPCSLVISHWQQYNNSVHKPLSGSGFYSRKIPYENRCLLSRFENRTLPLRFKSVWCLIN